MRTSGAAHNEHQRQYFSGRSLPRMDPVRRSATPYTLRHVDALVADAGIGPDDEVLDVGCGPGKYTVALARRGIRVTGMDLTPRLVDQLREVAPGIAAHVGDLAEPPADLIGTFDVVAGFFVLHHIADLPAAFAGARSLLRPGGRAAFVEPNPYFPGYYAQVTFTPGMSWKGEAGIFRMRPRVMRGVAQAAGFTDFRTSRLGAFPPALANRATGRRVEDLLERVPGWRVARAFSLFSMRVP
ncbi:MAG TPA: class I SAM-dependent methyltransferase [Acidimicrobiales bacterium]|nr:class I SAM-dependent methyltransferase [Acidimicrobiales bacterium]